MSTTPIHKLGSLGQSVWIDQISRGMITSSELERLRDAGVTGLTSNPTIFQKAIDASSDYDDDLTALADRGLSAEAVFESVALDDIRAACDLMRPVYDAAGGADGFVSFEVSPHLAHMTAETIGEARRLWDLIDRPNVMIKVPGTPEGVPAFRSLVAEGLNINVTLLFAVDAYVDVANAYIDGLEAYDKSGGDVGSVASVASFFVSRVDTSADTALQSLIDGGQTGLADLLGQAAVANARIAYSRYLDIFGGSRFQALRAKGAKEQRCLWASTSTKNPAYSDVLYVQELIAPNTVNTMPLDTIEAWNDHGDTRLTLEEGLDGAPEIIHRIESAGISFKEITDQLTIDGVKAFADSYDLLLSDVGKKSARLTAAAAS
ncbi:MAG: transaldolase [Chloroflexi bacterium]|nr:transaldolase [Chloroflexota bacterium]MCY3938555.1 transaldolase [Chloroflexota bacterium]